MDQEYNRLLSADLILFGHQRNPNIKIPYKVEVIQNVIAVKDKKVSSERLEKVLEMWNDRDESKQQRQLYEDDKEWSDAEELYLQQMQDNSWQTQEKEQYYEGEQRRLNLQIQNN